MKEIEEIKRANGSFVIFAAQPNEPHDVMQFFVEHNVPFKVLLGSYNGERETAYCVPQEHFETVIQAGLVDEHESVLVLGQFNSYGLRKADILFLDGREATAESAGFFVNTDRDSALKSNGWTFDPMGDKFFVIRTAAELVSAGLMDAEDGD